MNKTIYYIMGDFIEPQFDENGEEYITIAPNEFSPNGKAALLPPGFFDRLENKDGIDFVNMRIE